MRLAWGRGFKTDGVPWEGPKVWVWLLSGQLLREAIMLPSATRLWFALTVPI